MVKFARKEVNFGGATNFLVWLILAFIGVFIIRETPDGSAYFNIVVGSTLVFLLVLMFFFMAKQFQKRDDITDIRFPFADSFVAASFYFFIGIAIPFFFNLLTGLFGGPKSFSIIKPFVILSSASASGQQTFQGLSFTVIQTQLNSFWDTFLTVVAAGVLETWIFNFALIIVLLLIGYIIRKSFGFKLEESGATIFDYGIAITILTLLFMLAHKLNASYQTLIQFLIAGAFLLITNTFLFVFGVVIMAVTGFHMSNNCGVDGYAECLNNLFFTIQVPEMQIPLILLVLIMAGSVVISFAQDRKKFFRQITFRREQ